MGQAEGANAKQMAMLSWAMRRQAGLAATGKLKVQATRKMLRERHGILVQEVSKTQAVRKRGNGWAG